MFKIIAIICILIIVILFYMKLSSVKEGFTYGEGNDNYTDMDANVPMSVFSSKNEMIKHLQDYYIDAKSMVIFEKNGKKCAFYNTPATDKIFSRYIVPENMTDIEGVPYENVNTSVYTNDRHIDETDDNMKTVLNFNYNKNEDEVLSDENKTFLTDGSNNKLFNYETLPYYNSNKVPSQYVENYVICGQSNSYDKKAIQNLTDDIDIDKHFQAAFQCSGLVCGDMNTPDEDLIQKAFEYAHDEVLDKNKETIYDMLYSSNFLNWLLKLKKSYDTLDPSNRIV